MDKMKQCHISSIEVSEEDGFKCSDCGAWTCNSCGDGDLCNLCMGDEVFVADILGFEEEGE